MNDYQEWLDSLKQGDQVAVYNRINGYRICEIEKITPTRLIKLKGMTFRNGVETGDSWNKDSLEPITEIVISKIKRNQNLIQMSFFNFRNLNNEQLERVVSIMNEEEER